MRYDIFLFSCHISFCFIFLFQRIWYFNEHFHFFLFIRKMRSYIIADMRSIWCFLFWFTLILLFCLDLIIAGLIILIFIKLIGLIFFLLGILLLFGQLHMFIWILICSLIRAIKINFYCARSGQFLSSAHFQFRLTW